MFDQWHYTIPANTAETSKKTVYLSISTGIVTKVGVYFPFGCENLARCRVFLGNRPILPRSSRRYMHGNGVLIDTGDIKEPTRGQRLKIRWELWNIDDTFPHEITLNMTWLASLPEESIVLEVKTLTDAVRNFIKLLTGAAG